MPPPGRIPIEIGARRGPLLEVVARRADRWDVNLPPIPHRVERAAAQLAAACARIGRDPDAIPRSLWMFVRPGADPADPVLRREYLRWSPWFGDLPVGEIDSAIIAGDPGSCRMRIESLCRDLGVDLPVIDLSGLHFDAARQAIDALAPGKTLVDRSDRRP